ncbi:protein-lysine methyltransferase METTL21D [Nilaparvata lugens]|uniref:protein-lysine methyltransferase METTL21D n=1 Tax=Nilaparvata lugens TaxID=108931 RepID=UPI00193D6FB2|nr:protein-lysine methyltransferase METTL21D [Nilaparvata lugens]
MSEGTFTREVELNYLGLTLKLRQHFVGDVSCVVWDASIVLAKYLERLYSEQKKKFSQLNILELGAGLGCVGLTAACLGANVTVTDLPEVLPALLSNIEDNKSIWKKNGGKIKAKPIDWSSTLSLEEWDMPDLIVLADCVYYQESVNHLIGTMLRLSSDETEFLLCQEERQTDKQKNVWKNFLEKFETHFDFTKVPQSEQHEVFKSEDICILNARRKKL